MAAQGSLARREAHVKRIAIASIAAAMTWIACVPPAAAHNPSIHQAMTDLAWQMMVFVENNGVNRLGDDDAQWNEFLRRVAATPQKFWTRPAGLFDLVSTRTDACTPALADWNTTLHGVPKAPRWDFKDVKDCGFPERLEAANSTTFLTTSSAVPCSESGPVTRTRPSTTRISGIA
jgi:hypothetical protein